MSITDFTRRAFPERKKPVALRPWLWRSYLYAAIFPLLVIEIGFLAIYWLSNAAVYDQNTKAVTQLSHDFLNDSARREASALSATLRSISGNTELLAAETLVALKTPRTPANREAQRYTISSENVIYTKFDDGTSASFYSSRTPKGPEQWQKIWRLQAIDSILKHIKEGNDDIASTYFNSFDSYNRIYPYFDVISQYPHDMDIPSYNFYYGADLEHNPGKGPVWTDAYVDPAGQGWMVSSISPVWNGNRLEGVVGIDVTLEKIIDRLMALDFPWDGYAILVDRQGRIIAMPPAGEQDFGLRELTTHSYQEAIRADTFKPDEFNINRRRDTADLAAAMRTADSGEAVVDFDGPHLASFAKIPGPDWSLVIIAPRASIFANADTLRKTMQEVGIVMIVALLIFYGIFFALLYRRAIKMSQSVALPLSDISNLIDEIGAGNYRQSFSGSKVAELDTLGRQIVITGHQLGDAYQTIVSQERIVTEALAQQKQTNEDQIRFVRLLSHELRTPLSVIDSSVQIMARKSDQLTAVQVRDRASKIRSAVQRMSTMISKLVEGLAGNMSHAISSERSLSSISSIAETLASELIPPDRLLLDIDPDVHSRFPHSALTAAMRAVIENALLYSRPDGKIAVRVLKAQSGEAIVEISDEGPGISSKDLELVGRKFFRGENANNTQGTGMGLYVASNLIGKEDGRMNVASSTRGTTVQFMIPDQAEKSAPEQNAS